MLTHQKTLWILILLAALSLACSLVQSTPQATDTPTVPPTETSAPPTEAPATSTPKPTALPTATSAPSGSESELEIVNDTQRDIWYVYLSPTDADSWGDDQLGATTIAAGESYTLSGISDGVYDLQVRDENDEAIQTVWGIEIYGSVTQVISAQATLEIDNLTDTTIAKLYVSPTDSDTWGQDWLNGDTIPPDGVYSLADAGTGTFDLKVEDANEDAIETIYNVSLDGDYYWDIVGKVDLPSNAVLRFQDDFTDNRNNWGNTSTDTVTYNPPANGEYCIDINTDQMTAWEWYEPFRPDQFVAEVGCNVEQGSDASCGLGFGPDGDNLYWFEVSPSDQTYALFLLLNDEWQDSLISWTESKNITTSGWNYLSIERVNGVFSVYINGILQGSLNSDHFPTGRIGLGGATYSDGSARICLDNLRVWRME